MPISPPRSRLSQLGISSPSKSSPGPDVRRRDSSSLSGSGSGSGSGNCCGSTQARNVRVFARIRPMNELEQRRGCCTGVYPLDREGERTEHKRRLEHTNDDGCSEYVTSSPFKPFGVGRGNIPHDATPIVNNIFCSSGEKPGNGCTVSNDLPSRLIAEVSAANHKCFDLDGVFSPSATQKDVYERTVGDAVQRNILRGYSTTIIAYGQTGAGKTFTMGGPQDVAVTAGESTTPLSSGRRNLATMFEYESATATRTTPTPSSGLEDDDGVIPRAIHDLFAAKSQREESGSVSIKLSCLEIYNEELRDLLSERVGHPAPLVLRDHGDEGGVSVKGLKARGVESIEEVKLLMGIATRQRTTARTRLNEHSSRSHAICTLTVTVKPDKVKAGSAEDGQTAQGVVTAKLTLVDLAGSERLKQSGVVGLEQQESININKDLFVLGKVISALSEMPKKGTRSHVPYRDSKLTRFLRDSLGGNCCTVLIACVSPTNHDVDESVNTLRYAERARSITNTVKPNVFRLSMSPAQCVAMRTENKRLKSQILHLKKQLMTAQSRQSRSDFLHEDNDKGVSGLDSGLSGLQAKLKEAGEEAKVARQNSGLLSLQAKLKEAEDGTRSRPIRSESPMSLQAMPWDDKYDGLIKPPSKRFSLANRRDSTASFDLSLTPGDDDENSIVDDDSYLSWHPSTETGNDSLEEERRRLNAEIDSLAKDKITLTEQLADLSEQVESRNSDLDVLENRYTTLQTQLEKEELKRKDLDREVSQLKLKMHLLANDLKEEPSLQNGLRSIRRIRSADGGEEMGKEVEMSTMRRLHSRKTNPAQTAAEESIAEQMSLRKVPRTETDEKYETLRKENSGLREQNENLTSEIKVLRAALSSKCLLSRGKGEGEQRCPPEGSNYDGSSSGEITGTFNEKLLQEQKPSRDETKRLGHDLQSVREQTCEQEWGERSLSLEHVKQNGMEQSAEDVGRIGIEPFGPIVPECRKQQNLERMLAWADKAIEKKNRSSSVSLCSSIGSSIGTELRPSAAGLTGALASPGEDGEVVISNIGEMGNVTRCTCENSAISGNQEHVQFYLPKLAISCSCGKHHGGSVDDGGDACTLPNILRDWQVEFLNSLEIKDAVTFLHAYQFRRGVLAKQMRSWRRTQGLPSVKTRSCGVALHIWYVTVKKAVAMNRRPDFLDVTVASDNRTVSTLGVGSTLMDQQRTQRLSLSSERVRD